MHTFDSPLRRLGTACAALGVSLVLGGCAGNGDPRDPYEGFNRTVYSFNQAIDKAITRPLAKGYRAVVPDTIDLAITSFFNNLGDVENAINNTLQLKLTDAAEDVARIAVNSTIGLAGFVDIASGAGITRHEEDFGQTLGYWGMRPGAYVVLPLFGPSSARDTVGRGAGVLSDPLFYLGGNDVLKSGMSATRAIDRRADLLESERILTQATFDEYSFVRDAYLQRRRSLVHDGNPPPEGE